MEYLDKIKLFENVKSKIKNTVFGQDRVIDEVFESLTATECFRDRNSVRPRGIFLFAGTPGVGKTHLAETIADELGLPKKTLNMSSYSDDERGNASLFGSPMVFKGAGQGEVTSFAATNRGKQCIIILDEMEKAHINIILQFLQIFESGVHEDVFVSSVKKASPADVSKYGTGWALELDEMVSFKDAIFIITTNAGRSLYEDGKQASPDITKDAIIDAIRKDINPITKQPYFPDAILSRFQTGTVCLFRHISTHDMLKIGKVQCSKNVKMLKAAIGVDIEMQDEITLLMLLKEGGLVDARNFRQLSDDFLKQQLIRLGTTVKKEYVGLKRMKVEIDPDYRDALEDILYPDKIEQEVFVICEDEWRLNLLAEMTGEVEGIHVRKFADYDEAMEAVKREIYSMPIVLAHIPSVSEETSKTMASLNSAFSSNKMKKFREFIISVKKLNEKLPVFGIDLGDITEDTKKDILTAGVSEIITFDDPSTIASKIKTLIDMVKLENLTFQFARSGKALKYDIVPAVYGDCIYLRLRNFEKIDNKRSGDDEFFIGKDRMPNVEFKDVVGGDRIKAEAADFIAFLQNPKLFTGRGLKAPKGLLFYGPAGTGKTYMAKAIAHEAGVPFISTNGGDIRMGRGNLTGSELLKKYFAKARQYAPAILFIDEMETIALNRDGRDRGGDTIVNTLLSEMDGFEGHDSNPVIVIGATNAGIDKNWGERMLDPAVVRRFTRKFFVNLPLKQDRLIYLVDKTKLPKEELEISALMAQGLSFGKMQNAIEIAKRLAAREERKLTSKDVENAIETENYGDERAMSQESRERTAYHEAGHACVSCLYGGEHMPDHATIVSRGDFGGYVGTAENEESGSITKDYFEKRIRAMLAGRCAEVIHYGEKDGLTTGPSSDIQSAFNTIVHMISELAMDDVVGTTFYSLRFEDKKYIGVPEVIQKRVNVLFEQYYSETMEILKANMKLLEMIKDELLEKDSLSKFDLQGIVEKYNG